MAPSTYSRVPLLLLAVAAVVSVPAATLRALTETKPVRAGFADEALADDGTVLFTATNLDLDGGAPHLVDQVVRWDLVGGEASYVTDLPGGVVTRTDCAVPCSSFPVPSDDGTSVAFRSADDPLGLNPDGSDEVFVIRSDGTDIAQVTDTQPDSDVDFFTMSGSGNRVAFTRSVPGGQDLFVVDVGGGNLRQLTDRPSVGFATLSLSDDGNRLAFSAYGELIPGQNTDRRFEVFAIDSDGTGLRQVTDDAAGPDAGDPFLSGDGEWIAYQARKDPLGQNPRRCYTVFLVAYGGGTPTQLSPGCGELSASASPSMTDDGSIVYYSSDEAGALNADGNVEIWRVDPDGSSRQQLTDTTSLGGNGRPAIAGGGAALVFTASGPFSGGLNPRGDPAVIRSGADGSNAEVVVVEESMGFTLGDCEVTADGSSVVFVSDDNPLGANPQHLPQLFHVGSDGGGLAQVSGLTGGEVLDVGISADGETIVYSATGSPSGENEYCPGGNFSLNQRAHVYAIRADGSGMVDLTPGDCGGDHPVVSADGVYVVYEDVDHGRLYRVRPDGSDRLQISAAHGTEAVWPRLDADGSWVVYQSSLDPLGTNSDRGSEIFRVRIDGSDLEQLTQSPPGSDAIWPDVSADGERISFVSGVDPFGTNADHNREVFLLDIPDATLTQLTDTAGISTDSSHTAISGNGAWVYFDSGFDFFEPTIEYWSLPYRVEVASGRVERVGGLAQAPMALTVGNAPVRAIAPDHDGNRALLIPLFGDLDGSNPDESPEVWLADFTAAASIDVGPLSPTLISWTVDPRYLRYDVIRGEVGALGDDGASIGLGPVVCVENDSTNNDTAGHEVLEEPAPGQVFFFLYRGTPGGDGNSASYGEGTGGKERVPDSGDCPV